METGNSENGPTKDAGAVTSADVGQLIWEVLRKLETLEQRTARIEMALSGVARSTDWQTRNE